MPYSPANVLRSLADRHPEQADELRTHAVVLESVGRLPLTRALMKEINAAWARGTYWCNAFKNDENPLTLR